MEIEIQNVKKTYSSCNFCTSKLNNSGNGLVYSYDEVIVFMRNEGGVCVSMCKECLTELIEKAKTIKFI